MCLVFCAFASWAVKTSDLQAPDAWKTSTCSARLERAGKGSRGRWQGGKSGYLYLQLPLGKCSLFLVLQSRFCAFSFPSDPDCCSCLLCFPHKAAAGRS
uniref:Uncharacterized protein n=1 Tax=Geospiza parvula TaxID=87175 RepID=A0A8C3NEJ1_GEOPR